MWVVAQLHQLLRLVAATITLHPLPCRIFIPPSDVTNHTEDMCEGYREVCLTQAPQQLPFQL